MRFPPVQDIPHLEKVRSNINTIDLQMHQLVRDVCYAVTHNTELHSRSRELAGSLDDLLVQHTYTHQSMRLLLRQAYRKRDFPIVADTASLAREQVEKIYQAVILSQGPHKWHRQYLRNSWQKSYERYLLEMDEYGHIARFREHLDGYHAGFLEVTRKIKIWPSDSILVSDFAKRVVEYEWHNRKGTKSAVKPSWFTRKGSVASFLRMYFYFPTPWDVMTKVRNRNLLLFLDRWYREYKMLSEYSHVLMGKITPQRTNRDKSLKAASKSATYGKNRAQEFIVISNIAAASLCTVIMPHLPNDYGSKASTIEYWKTLSDCSLFAKGLWNLYAKRALS